MSEPFDHLLEKYARLVIRVGVNVQPGQEVIVTAPPRAGRRSPGAGGRGLPRRCEPGHHRLPRPAPAARGRPARA